MTTRKNLKKRVSTVTAVLLAAAMLLGATYAWNDTRQHKTNPFAASNAKGVEGMETRDVSLNNLFTPPSGWSWPADPQDTIETPNTVSVTNTTSSTTHTFVRLSLKQYMELRSTGKDENGNEIFYRKEPVGNQGPGQGDIILIATWASGPNIGKYLTSTEAQQQGLNYGVHQVPIGVDAEGKPIYQDYATTAVAETRNGIYGKPMVKSSLEVVWGEVPKAPLNHGPQTPGQGECAYTPQINGASSLRGNKFPTATNVDPNATINELDKYVQIGWTKEVPNPTNPTEMRTNIMSFSEWNDPQGNNAEWVNAWIYDDTKLSEDDIAKGQAQEGWIYWGTPLQSGQSTTNLIDHVATTGNNPMTSILSENIEGKIDYILHTDMEAVSGFTYDATGEVREKSEVDSLFKPTLPTGQANTQTKAGRDAFFAAMNQYEEESFEDRAILRTNHRVVRYNLSGHTDAGFTLANPVSMVGGIYRHEFKAPTTAPADKIFLGWATSKTDARDGKVAITYNATSKTFTPGAVDLSVDVMRYFAVWGDASTQ